MGNQTVTVLCGTCNVGIEGPTDPNPDDTMTCPSCGRSDNFKNVMVSVEKHSLELMEQKLQDTFESGVRGSKFIKFEGKTVPKCGHPFITNLKL